MKYLISRCGLSQKEFADKIQTHPQTVSRWVKNAHLSTDVLEKVCQALDIELWEFFVEEQALDEKYGIPKEYRELIKEVLRLDEEARIDVLEMFLLSLQKYKKALSK